MYGGTKQQGRAPPSRCFVSNNRRSEQIDQPEAGQGDTQVDAEHAAQRLLILFLMENEPNQAILDAQVPPPRFPSWTDSGPFLDRRCVSGPRAEKG